MAPGISYDDQGSLASYFAITFLSLVLIPSTILYLKPSKDAVKKASRCQCSECTANEKRLAKLKGKRGFGIKPLLVLAGWIAFAYLSYTIAVTPKGENVVYNPFEILGLGSASTEKQIKKHYKKLSLQFHPDKIKLSENQTQEDADAHFVELTKAYKALTDEGIRENLAKYGNPDGPQQREDKIAIPQWVVEGKNNIWVLGVYGLVIGGGIPWAVGRWWFSQRELTRDGTLNATAELIFKNLSDDIDFASVIALLASAFELRRLLGGAGADKKKAKGAQKKAIKKERAGKMEELEKEVVKKGEEWGVEGVMSGQFTSGPNRHAAVLLWSHLLRIDVDEELERERLAVLRVLPPVLNSVQQVALSHNWLETSLLAISLQPHLVQALPPGVPAVQQLPKINNKTAEALEVKGAEGSKWMEKFVAMGDEEKIDADLSEAQEVASKWPRLEVVDAEFKVEGEKIVTPGAIVQFTYNVRYNYPTAAARKPSNGSTAGDVKNEASDFKEKVQEKAAETVEDVKAKLNSASEVVYEPNGYAHAPCWPQHRKPHWWVLIGDTKLNRVIVQPSRITDIPMPKADGSPSEPRELKLQFQAPPQPGVYTFFAYWRSDTWLGADIKRSVTLKVEDASLLEDEEADDDISDPEEDSLAGQMAQMRGGSVKKSAVHGEDDESSEEESSDEEGPANRRPADSSDSDSD